MRILFDAYWWETGPPSGRLVVQQIVRQWKIAFPQDEIAVALKARDVAALSSDFPDVQILALNLKPHALAVLVELPLRRLFAFPRSTMFTQNFSPIFGRSVTFVHDAMFRSNPEWFTFRERVYLSLIAPSLRIGAPTVLTSSRSEAYRILQTKLSKRPVHPVGLGISEELICAIPQAPARLAQINKFALSVGRLNTRKNLSRLLEAAKESTVISPEFPLVVVGEESGRLSGESTALGELLADGSVILLGKVTDAELKWLYQHGQVLAYVSLDEGFGLPPVEAHAFGMPLILSDIPVFKEVNTTDALFVDPRSVKAIAAALDVRCTGVPREAIEPTNGGWQHVVATIRNTIAESRRDNR